ncbi:MULTISPECIES: DUF6761 family protein [Prochlorococcus]|uniref:DUF6761 family protein n=1 Tax=Prochlorococcus TaxID=1218 RepID=UPI000533844A|nr:MULTISPECIES: DUF6761 family protein [Prochlorococcus]KGG12273.1 hypothetical protein EV05_1483 [Prochlorococcus sp. MIT 0601]
MTSQTFEDPEAIKHFQAICDACQELISRYHSPSELKLYADGYIDALRKTKRLNSKDQEKLEKLVNRWILDPSSFVGPDGDINNLYFLKRD